MSEQQAEDDQAGQQAMDIMLACHNDLLPQGCGNVLANKIAFGSWVLDID